jgi:hypothetical protein
MEVGISNRDKGKSKRGKSKTIRGNSGATFVFYAVCFLDISGVGNFIWYSHKK